MARMAAINRGVNRIGQILFQLNRISQEFPRLTLHPVDKIGLVQVNGTNHRFFRHNPEDDVQVASLIGIGTKDVVPIFSIIDNSGKIRLLCAGHTFTRSIVTLIPRNYENYFLVPISCFIQKRFLSHGLHMQNLNLVSTVEICNFTIKP